MLTDDEREIFDSANEKAIEWHKKEAAHAQKMVEEAAVITTRWDRAKWFLIGCVTGAVSQFVWEVWLDVG